MSSRRKAREALLKALYLSECRGFDIASAFEEMAAVGLEIAEKSDDPDVQTLKPFALGLDEKQKQFALSLGKKIEENREKMNNLIKPVLVNWDFSRVSRIDRIILWIALAEMLYMLDISHSVSINEAIELSKKYSSEKSSSFINGILDTISQQISNDKHL